jgi:hypothetical protein
MPVPDRPIDAAEIATEWGQWVHDFVFAPAGCRVTGGEVAAPSGDAWVTLPIDTASVDPGGYADLTNNRLEVPEQEGATVVSEHLQADEELAVNDQITVQGRQIGSGTRADLSLTRLFIIRVGDELGAPTA